MQTSVVSPQKLAVLALAIVLLLVSASALAQSIDIDTLCDGRVKLDWGDGSGTIYFDRVVGNGLELDNGGSEISSGPTS